MEKNIWVDKYWELIKRLEINGNFFGIFKDIQVSKVMKNEQTEFGWKYSRHHLCEIVVSGADLEKNRTKYDNEPAVIVDIMEHSLLHYIIVMAQTTSPNSGMLQYFRKVNKGNPMRIWEFFIKKGCEKYNIPFHQEWRDSLI